MKKTLITFIVIAFFACNSNRHLQGAQIGLVNLTHYYLKNSASLNGDYTGIVISGMSGFTDMFYTDNTPGEKMIVPDFSGQTVVALAVNTIEHDNKVTFTKAEINGKHLNVFGTLTNVKQDTEAVPTAVATVPKSLDVKEVNFYVDGKLVKTTPVPANNSNILVEVTSQEHQHSASKNTKRKPAII